MEKKEIRNFNLEYLKSFIDRDNAILTGDYPNLSSSVNITFICICKKDTNKLFRDIVYYGGAFCKECIKKNRVAKIKQTCNKIYGVDNPSQLDEVKNKKENTYLKNYGDHPKRVKEVNDKYMNTCLKKYGCINAAQSIEVKNKIKNTFDEKYNGHPMFIDEIKNKVKNIFNEKYNGHPMFVDEIKNKVKATCFKKYGGYPSESINIKNKTLNTNLFKYGCHPSQTPAVIEKIMKSSNSYKKYKMPSGELRNIQGYEHFALDILLKEYNEEQIITDRYNMPIINYKYNDTSKRYFPDIYIPHKNLIIEVKSEWIYNLNLEINKVKEQYTKEQGYNYEVWKFNSKGVKL